MPFVASGSYGCVFRPHLKCKDKKTYKDSVGKVFENKDEFNTELSTLKMLKEIDPQQKFTLPLLDDCITTDKNRKSDEINKCSLMDDKNNYNQIILRYGGKSLGNIMLSKRLSHPLFFKIFNILEPIFEGLITLNKHELIHQDIKPENIMYRKGKLYLIDFGLVYKYNNVYNKYNNLLNADYAYFPPEYKLYMYMNTNTQTNSNRFISKFLNNFVYSIFIAGIPINIQTSAESILHINYNQELKEFYNTKKKLFKSLTSKIDTYQLGMTLFLTFISAGLHTVEQKRITKKIKIINELKELIKYMIHPNPYKRYDAIQAFEHYKRIKNIT